VHVDALQFRQNLDASGPLVDFRSGDYHDVDAIWLPMIEEIGGGSRAGSAEIGSMLIAVRSRGVGDQCREPRRSLKPIRLCVPCYCCFWNPRKGPTRGRRKIKEDRR
jgi:hypothetical protein